MNDASTNSNTDLVRALCRESYTAYCWYVHGGRWIDSRFHKFLAETLQSFVETKTGHPYDVLVISAPPQHGKSMTCTETLPSWYLGKYPSRRVIVGGYNDEFAGKFGRRNLRKLKEKGEFLFGVQLVRSSDRDIETSEGGSIITRGIMAGITGNAAELILIDDPIKNRLEADSPTYRDRLWDEWNNSIKTRTQAGTKIIVMLTRWHEDDLAGRIIKNEKNVRVVNIPLEAEDNDPLGRRPGEALCPEIGKDDKWLREFKASYSDGARAWNALMQGRPTAEEGNLFKREWWKFYDVLPDDIPLVVISIDATFKSNADSDYVAIETWGKKNADFYLMDLVKKRMDFPETVRAIRAMNAKYPQRHSILIEDKANGPAIIAMLQHEIPGIVPVTPLGSKIARANAITGLVESGNVYLPKFADYTDDFIEEHAAFPNGVHDDLVDAADQFLNKFKFYGADVVVDNRSQLEKDLEKYKNRVISGVRRTRRGFY